MRILLTISYNGKNYHGFQKQNNAKTIQGELENVLKVFTKEEIKTIGASRTDAGVHSLASLVVFDTTKNIPADKWCYILNNMLPDDIVVKNSKQVDDRYHPLRNMYKKTYVYKIDYCNFPNPLHLDTHLHINEKLDIEKMKSAAKLFIGEHDFKAFKSGNKIYKTTVRHIYESKIELKDDVLTYTVTGNGFMYNMVRIMVGTLLDIGRNRISNSDILDMIYKQNRAKIGSTIASKGLCLYSIEELFINYE